MADNPDVIEQMPAGGGVNTPDSGSYGDQAALDRLQAELPGLDSSTPEQPGAGALPPPYQGTQPPPPGLPPSLFAPSNLPNVPASTPLDAPVPPPPDPTQQRILILQSLIEGGSEEARQWAQIVLNKIIRSSQA